MGDAAVSEEKVVEATPIAQPEKEEKTEKKSTSTKKAKSRGQSLAIKELQQTKSDSEEELDLFKNNIYIVFVECETPGNIGFLARTMANFGLRNLVLINPPTLTPEAYYQATHGKYIVENALVYPNLNDFYQSKRIDFKIASTGIAGGSYNLSRIPLKPEDLAKSINVNNKIAILFGREGDGLSNKEIEDCDICVSIPTDPTYPILNISHAAAIIFYELFKNKHEFPVEGLEESSHLEKEYLVKDMTDLINSLDIPEHKKKNGLKTFRNIINRAFITGREAHTFKGILRRLKNKIGEQ
ncbi:TrmJ/YjtD family RNA methyltransferase [Methanobrevibacter millerae]|uniref:RNA methyltransferase, TrmH family, group 1 n=1 Tax=Methanobrevibacter millerae TaxID=230361 RepID=A0A1G5VYU2_9EURY|nr:TrmJ/YjtD family RNA methyltransferase [Methanobrevibacter millerae]SDA50125.1 RNA methyltransferase, TrmH family, group 1 [Methanobrevibacter millerae]